MQTDNEVRRAHRQTFRARTNYHCDGCGKPIDSGRRYVRTVDSRDNKFEMKRYHLRCVPTE